MVAVLITAMTGATDGDLQCHRAFLPRTRTASGIAGALTVEGLPKIAAWGVAATQVNLR
jgi:hypothetical protein